MAPIRIAHISVQPGSNLNSGDTALVQATRKVFESHFGRVDWTPYDIWKPYRSDEVQAINETSDMVIVGGGGLLLRDQSGSSIDASGWQWNISPQQVEALNVPLVVFAVGYNRFRGQQDFSPNFAASMRSTVGRAGFFGLRNHGSVRTLRTYLPDALGDKVEFQPCPTVLSFDQFRTGRSTDLSSNPTLAINVAYDRPVHRYGGIQRVVMDRLCAAVGEVASSGWTIDVVAHKPQDVDFCRHLAVLNIPHRLVDLTYSEFDEMRCYYSAVDLVAGMRGHAQMIPFGVGTPIFSLVSHDKLSWFLDDCGMSTSGAEIQDPKLGFYLAQYVNGLSERYSTIRDQMSGAQDQFTRITGENLTKVAALMRDGAQDFL